MYDIGKKVNIQIDQWNRIEFRNRLKQMWSSDFKKNNGAVVIQHRKGDFFNKRCWTYIFKKMNLDLTLTHKILTQIIALNNSNYRLKRGFPHGSEDKASACNLGDMDLIAGSGRSPGEENGNPLQYSCLENSMDGATW